MVEANTKWTYEYMYMCNNSYLWNMYKYTRTEVGYVCFMVKIYMSNYNESLIILFRLDPETPT